MAQCPYVTKNGSDDGVLNCCHEKGHSGLHATFYELRGNAPAPFPDKRRWWDSDPCQHCGRSDWR